LCGPAATWQDVELYNGALGPSVPFVGALQKSVGQIQWNDLAKKFSRRGDDAGDVTGKRWCSGSLIGESLFLTAAHCFEVDSGGWRTPRRGAGGSQQAVPPAELATLMHVNFDYQIARATGKVRPDVSYPVVRLVEYGFDAGGKGLDFAIIELGAGGDGTPPG